MLSQGLEQVEVRERVEHSVPDVLVATCGAEIGRPKVSQVWSAAIRQSEWSASTKGPCLPRFRLQMVWKDSMKERGGGGNPPSTFRSRQRLPTPSNTWRPSARRRRSFGADDFWSMRGRAGANRSATVSGFARQETTPPPAAGEDVIFHFPAHATSPTVKREKKVVNLSSSLFSPPTSILLSRFQAPMTLNALRVPPLEMLRGNARTSCAVVVTVTRACCERVTSSRKYVEHLWP